MAAWVLIILMSTGPDHVYMESQQSCEKAREVIAENKPFGYEVKTMCVKR
ncbi:hypothetical protein FDI22_gp55 [Shigella phage vB_SsoS-ISF002]|uniref:Uncharacterized protein n=1 Tax=Shigella phage vB_SsoS-ISF002 TaxID=2006922 RepID=A0A218M4B6_9CAUD|nr:hypothetical protein FDI22_gp55 [Shigella phage vB_SsoS-ISF002]ASD50939.1 hypothetical protein ISF001_0055 [Shigella phage vB_SsoS-ISF002]WPK33288.1 hypothetical protein [Escherichia phage AV106]DAT48349.1 MAG TPA: glycoside hydrolase [Caudoviricetes sp.]